MDIIYITLGSRLINFPQPLTNVRSYLDRYLSCDRWLDNNNAILQTVLIRSRLEGIQHANILNHIVSAGVYRNEILTEDMIRSAHGTVYCGSNLDNAAWTEYTEKYQDCNVSHAVAGQKRPYKFIAHGAVPGFMQQLVAEYQNTIDRIESTGQLTLSFTV